MTDQVFSIIGSGTIPFTRGILPASQRGVEPDGEGLRRGIQVILANPEDLNSVDAIATSGVTIGTTPVQIAGPGVTPLPRIRGVRIFNASSSSTAGNVLWIGPQQDFNFISEGIPLFGSAAGHIVSMDLPILHNVPVWARSAANSIPIRMLYY